jgi:hypothetical protein
MSDEETKHSAYMPAPMEPPPAPAPPGATAPSHTPSSPTVQGSPKTRPHEGYYYQISRRTQQPQAAVSESHLWQRQKQLTIGDTLIIDTACAVACWVYVVESDTKLGNHRVKMCFHTDGFRQSHKYTVSEKFDKLRVIFSDSEVPGISMLSTASEADPEQSPTGWLQNLDRFNPSGAIGGRGHGPIPTPEESSMAPRFCFGPNSNDMVQIQEKFLLRRLPSGFFLDVQIS